MDRSNKSYICFVDVFYLQIFVLHFFLPFFCYVLLLFSYFLSGGVLLSFELQSSTKAFLYKKRHGAKFICNLFISSPEIIKQPLELTLHDDPARAVIIDLQTLNIALNDPANVSSSLGSQQFADCYDYFQPAGSHAGLFWMWKKKRFEPKLESVRR